MDLERQRYRFPMHAKPRYLTDKIWLYIFGAFILLMIVIGVFALVHGKPKAITNGYDSFGNICGAENKERVLNMTFSGKDMTDRPFLLSMDVRNAESSLNICVKECPDRNMPTYHDFFLFFKETDVSLCSYGFDVNESYFPYNDLSSHLGPCPLFPVYKSLPILNRCIPIYVNTKEDGNDLSLFNNMDTVQKIVCNLYTTWKEIIVLKIEMFLFTLAMVAILHWLVYFVPWVFAGAVFITLIVSACVLWGTYVDAKNALNNTPFGHTKFEQPYSWRPFVACAGITIAFAVPLLILVLCVKKSMSYLCQIFNETMYCIMAMPLVVLQPFLTFFTLFAFFSTWLYTMVCMASSNEPVLEYYHFYSDPDSQTEETAKHTFPLTTSHLQAVSSSSDTNIKYFTWVSYVENTWVRYMWIIYVIGLIWISEFILMVQQTIIAGAVSNWYFDMHRADNRSVISAMKTVVRYHLGSIVKCSFLTTVFKLPRLVITYLDKKLKKMSENGSRCAQCFVTPPVCCLSWLKTFVVQMNKKTCNVIAMEGLEFYTSAQIVQDALDIDALGLKHMTNSGDLFVLGVKCTVTAITAIASLLLMVDNHHLHYFVVPVAVICVFAYYISYCILSLYEVILDTLFFCKYKGRNLYGPQWVANRPYLPGRNFEMTIINPLAFADPPASGNLPVSRDDDPDN